MINGVKCFREIYKNGEGVSFLCLAVVVSSISSSEACSVECIFLKPYWLL